MFTNSQGHLTYFGKYTSHDVVIPKLNNQTFFLQNK